MSRASACRYLVIVTGFMSAMWLTGLIFFVTSINHFAEPAINQNLVSADAIVVLTGGSERISTGIDLLVASKGKKLLISGVHQGTNVDKIISGKNVPQELRNCCITLGHVADNTVGNAEETSLWMREQDFHSLRLVTSHYHMPRSLLLFHEILPDIEIIPHPVVPESVQLTDWWTKPGTSSLLVTEYTKYILAALRMWLGSFL